MISAEGFKGLVESAGEAYNKYCMVLETLGIDENGEGAIMTHIDKLLNIAVNEMEDGKNKSILAERMGEDFQVENRCYWEYDMPLVIHFAWNLNFGDGNKDGEVTTIILEGSRYKLDNADTLYQCLMHLNSLWWHYYNDELKSEPMYEGDDTWDQLTFGEGYSIIYM